MITPTLEEVHTYISYYNLWAIWRGWQSESLISGSLQSLRDAYLYTGDVKYGRVGAILLDRIADIYPDMDVAAYYPNFSNSDGSSPKGKILGKISEREMGNLFARSYDAFFPVLGDPQVIEFLNERAIRYQLENDKSSAEKIRKNMEDRLLRETFKAVVDGNILGNFGMHQGTVALAAVALDTMPETREWIDWIFKAGPAAISDIKGGDVLPKLVNYVDHDGMGDESSPSYNYGWVSDLETLLDTLSEYPRYQQANLYNNPKYIKMLMAAMPITLTRKATAHIGDSGHVAGVDRHISRPGLIKGFQHTGSVEIAQALYWFNGNSTDGLRYDIFTRNPESLAPQLDNIIQTHGEYDFDISKQLTGYGFSILRDGVYIPSVGANTTVNTQRDFWLYWGGGTSHKHPDMLNLGMEAYGLNLAPELGYPEASDGGNKHQTWSLTTVSHNTVLVNGKNQTRNVYPGKPLHFDDGGRVKLMDVDGGIAYPDVDIYRRTVVMVKVSEEVSYGVDFFRVRGGTDHLYSFHSQSDEITEVTGVNLARQPMGTYAGPSVAWGTAGYSSGFSWLSNVRRALNPQTGEFSVNFKVKDFRNTLDSRISRDLNLRMTMLNDPLHAKLDEVAIVEGNPPKTAQNPNMLEFVFARRRGTDLDTLFTTVFEPYRKTRYMKDIQQVPINRIGGERESERDAAKAVRITLNDGRVDYIVYTTNDSIEYRVDNTFNFRGFVGVYTLKDGKNIYSYACDSLHIGEITGENAYTGTVMDFTRELAFENKIIIKPDSDMDIDALSGAYIYVTGSEYGSGAYEIHGATKRMDGMVELDIGDVTLIHRYRDNEDFSKGYLYHIAPKMKFRIPLRILDDKVPIFEEIPMKTVDTNSEIRFSVHALSQSGLPLTYSATALPRGASFNPDTRMFSWIPEFGQVGKNHVCISASDGQRESTLNIIIQVLPGTISKSSPGGVPGGSNGNPITPPPLNPPSDKEDLPTGRFSDLGGYNWAEKAITSLAQAGVIKGTGETTYAPGKNITRADFTILLVRAFRLNATTDSNFEDVDKGAYYANEVAVAKAAGIILGDGQGLFRPEEHIKREDMMVITARAIEAYGHTLSEADKQLLEDFEDNSKLADYAESAVAALIKAELIRGDGGRINPKGNATRAEVAVMLHRILETIGNVE